MSCALWSDPQEARQTLAQALRLAIDAGKVIRELGVEMAVMDKGLGHDVVTEADRRAETLIVDGLAAAFPDHRIVGEEGSGRGPETALRCWHVDPLDGTANFSRSIPYWAVSIGLAWRGKPVLGVIHAPELGLTLEVIRSQGVWLNDQPLAPARAVEEDPRRWIVAVDWPWDLAERQRTCALLSALAPRIRQYKTYGSAALDCLNLARGRLDAYCISDVFSWDLCAGAAALQELGFSLADWQGQPWRLGRGAIRACRPGGQELLDACCHRAWQDGIILPGESACS
ncbi:MAG: hypothetical protein EA402_07475 [Planctomycetota bacterium]|nr:MAG: hypothetical protein EA402_07475 [Planctomycetota bacterium]